MNRSILIMALALAFVTGCLAASVAQNFVAPPVRAGTNPQKWEIMCISAKEAGVGDDEIYEATEADGWNPALAKMGAQGWEPIWVAYNEGMASMRGFCFKRPLS